MANFSRQLPCLCPLGNEGPLSDCGGACAAELRDLCRAIGTRTVVRFTYDGFPREVEPHCYGVTTRGNQAVRGYQTNWGGVTPEPGWHMFRVDRIASLGTTSVVFEDPRAGYNANDPAMNGFFARVRD